MIDSYKEYWKKAFTTYGRTSRRDFWNVVFVTFVISFCIGFVMGLAGVEDETSTMIAYIWDAINLIPGISIGARRMHDINRNGWWIFIPFVNIIFWCLPSVNENNNY